VACRPSRDAQRRQRDRDPGSTACSDAGHRRSCRGQQRRRESPARPGRARRLSRSAPGQRRWPGVRARQHRS